MEGAERIAAVFCSTPVCLKDERTWAEKTESVMVAEEGGQTVTLSSQTERYVV